MRSQVATVGLVAMLSLVTASDTAGLRRVARPESVVAASGRSATVAYLVAPGKLAVRTDAVRVGTVAVPGSCAPAAVSDVAVGLTCGRGLDTPAVLELRDASMHSVPLDQIGAQRAFVRRIGRKWVEIDAATPPAANGASTMFQALVNWHTGDAVDLRRDPFGATHVIDLDRTPPERRLCKPLRRTTRQPSNFDDSTFLPAFLMGSWLVQGSDEGIDVRRCRSREHHTYRNTANATINARFIAYRTRSSVRLVDNRTHKRRILRFPRGTAPIPTLSRHLLYIRKGTALGSPLYSFRLP